MSIAMNTANSDDIGGSVSISRRSGVRLACTA